MTKGHIERFDKAKEEEGEIPKEGSDKQQSKGFLPAYLRKFKEEVDFRKVQLKNLWKLGMTQLTQKCAGRSPINEGRKGKVDRMFKNK